jgi:hypothetical protein
MTDQQAARDSGLTTEEAASPGTTARDDIRAEAPSQESEDPVSRGFIGEAKDAEARAQQHEGEELHPVITRWKDIQARFVDEPRAAVYDADALVADLMQRLTRMLAAERHQLETHWTSGEHVSTEDLRQCLLRYRSFFERLFAASGGTST